MIGEVWVYGRHSLDVPAGAQPGHALRARACDPHARRAAATLLQDAPLARRAPIIGRGCQQQSEGVPIVHGEGGVALV
jgi:hypothetical protein